MQKYKTICIYPGRFQMPHEGHIRTYKALQKRFDDVFIAMTDMYDDSNSDSPFNFSLRHYLLGILGIECNKIAQVKNPYRANEIVDYLSPDTRVVFAVGKKDEDRFNFELKQNGTKKYLQRYDINKKLKPQTEHAYVLFMPTLTYKINEQEFTSASELRNYYKNNLKTPQERKEFCLDVYGEVFPVHAINDSLGIKYDDI